jgi:hypothetical protein
VPSSAEVFRTGHGPADVTSVLVRYMLPGVKCSCTERSWPMRQLP